MQCGEVIEAFEILKQSHGEGVFIVQGLADMLHEAEELLQTVHLGVHLHPLAVPHGSRRGAPFASYARGLVLRRS